MNEKEEMAIIQKRLNEIDKLLVVSGNILDSMDETLTRIENSLGIDNKKSN